MNDLRQNSDIFQNYKYVKSSLGHFTKENTKFYQATCSNCNGEHPGYYRLQEDE